MKKIEEIDKLLCDKPYLICELVYERDIDFVKKVISMSEWKEERFRGLLTSNIWNSNYEEIKNILSMKEFSNTDYCHLLVPSIFNVSLKNIRLSIGLLKEYNIDKFITNRFMRRNVNLQRKLIEYMINKNIDLIVVNNKGKYTLNPILNASNTELKTKYGIDVKNLPNKGVKR